MENKDNSNALWRRAEFEPKKQETNYIELFAANNELEPNTIFQFYDSLTSEILGEAFLSPSYTIDIVYYKPQPITFANREAIADRVTVSLLEGVYAVVPSKKVFTIRDDAIWRLDTRYTNIDSIQTPIYNSFWEAHDYLKVKRTFEKLTGVNTMRISDMPSEEVWEEFVDKIGPDLLKRALKKEWLKQNFKDSGDKIEIDMID